MELVKRWRSCGRRKDLFGGAPYFAAAAEGNGPRRDMVADSVLVFQ